MFSETENQSLEDYSKAIQTICICLVISVILIIIFVISPLKKIFYVSVIGKIICLVLLGFTLYKNIIVTNKTDELEKANRYGSYILSFFIIILILSVLRKMFMKSENHTIVQT